MLCANYLNLPIAQFCLEKGEVFQTCSQASSYSMMKQFLIGK